MTWLPEFDTGDEDALWVASGAAELTGRPGGPPRPAPGAPASLVRAALADIAVVHPGARLPGVGLLGERAAIAGYTRNAPWSCGGAFRILPTADGWFGLSLARPDDLALVPALVGGTDGTDPWRQVAAWLAGTATADADERVTLLGLPGAPVPRSPAGPRRPPIAVTSGGPAARPERPLVVDLTALWAGPLCGRLLALTGARVVKVESTSRPDGARRGPAAFFDLLNGLKDSLVLDLDHPDGRHRLRELVDRADVVLEASRPRALRGFGLDAQTLVAQGKVWLSITAYGRADGDAMRVGFGDDVAAGAGLVGWDDRGPYPVGDALADPLAGVVAAAAVVRALDATHGVLLDVSMHDVAALAAAAR